MADITSWVSTAPSDGSLVFPTARFLRQQWTLTDIGLRQSLVLPDGTLKQGAAPISVDVESNLSATNNAFETHARLVATSDTSRVVMYRRYDATGTAGSARTFLAGSHKFIEHSDYTSAISRMRATTSGASSVPGTNRNAGSIGFNFSDTGVGTLNFEFDEPPLVNVSTHETTSDTNYIPRVSNVTNGGFTVVMRPVDLVDAGSAVSVIWSAYGYRSQTL